LKGVTNFRNSVNDLRGKSRELNLASRGTVTILDLLLSDIQGAEAYTIKIIDLIDEKLKEFKK